MLNKVPKINYERCYPSRLKKFFRADINYKTYNSFVPNVKNPIIGNIPADIIDLFKKDKGTNIKYFQNSLSNITKYLRACYKNMKKENIILSSFKDLADELPIFEMSSSEIAAKCLKNVLPQGVHAEIRYVGRGVWGNVFKFSLKNKNGEKIIRDKALKVYHNPQIPTSRVSHMHNNYAEANFWSFLKFVAGHKLDKSQFTRHYISDLKNGYAMTDYIDEQICKTTSRLCLKNLFGILSKDPNKPIQGKLYDAGGFVKAPDFIDDKVVRRYFKKLWYRNSEKELNTVILDLENKISNPKTPHREKIKKAIELFKQKQNKNN